MSSSPIPAVPSVRSRHPRRASNQAELDTANDWIASSTLEADTCPVNAVTKAITAETSIGKTVLSKYDPSKFQSLYGNMGTTERIHIVDDLRAEVRSRQESAQKWREVMEMVASEQSASDGKVAEEWELLNTACKEALKNTAELLARLAWCERDFEAGRLTPAVIAERRVWEEGAEVELREKE